MRRFFVQVIAGILGLWLAVHIVPGVDFTGDWWIWLLIGAVLGFINYFIRPIVQFLTLPLRILTLGIFGLVINMIIVWAIDVMFSQLIISGIMPLLWSTLVVWAVGVILPLFFGGRKKHWWQNHSS